MDLVSIAKNELHNQSEAIAIVADRIGKEFEAGIKILLERTGKIIVCGMGKTGIIGRKIAATLSSTGSTAIFLHAAEGIHGDLGLINPADVIIAISYSGNTAELISLIPFFKFQKNKIISITGNLNSKLSHNSDVILDCSIPQNYEKFGLVPTVSTTVCLAMGDAIAVGLMNKNKFEISDYALLHPGGTIGKKILMKVKDIMHTGEKIPTTNINSSMKTLIINMTSFGLGCTIIVDDNQKLCGFVSDGDLKRILQLDKNFFDFSIEEIMIKNPRFVGTELLAIDALNLMEQNKITNLPVIENEIIVGILHLHTLIDAGLL